MATSISSTPTPRRSTTLPHLQQHQPLSPFPSPSPSSTDLKNLTQTLDKAHRSLSNVATKPFLNTQQALDQTANNLIATARNLSDATQNLVRAQVNLEALICGIKHAQDFFPNDNDTDRSASMEVINKN
ncbi:hypothetical protein BC939DRAFT_457084 [Gamsiella multidivaricata]|uniref:uncharacterized protein n=1 Tax=Gamsiella multidivaricata TaxID=101098 RepID=UPI00221F6691|nr:uncharacterized protein BC939DRAFT_457084 [Gamsiella multidivaricata]KAI7820844.1 hypothetical protein BC939DRAFT_457084 [Gamsiella multidivaricata]